MEVPSLASQPLVRLSFFVEKCYQLLQNYQKTPAFFLYTSDSSPAATPTWVILTLRDIIITPVRCWVILALKA